MAGIYTLIATRGFRRWGSEPPIRDTKIEAAAWIGFALHLFLLPCVGSILFGEQIRAFHRCRLQSEIIANGGANRDFRGADLSRADLSEADLGEAHLIAAYMSEADLRGADLHRARVVAKIPSTFLREMYAGLAFRNTTDRDWIATIPRDSRTERGER